jgi:hypothetical protein
MSHFDRVHKTPQLYPLLRHSNPVHTLISYFSTFHYNTTFSPPNCYIPSGYLTKITHPFLASPCTNHHHEALHRVISSALLLLTLYFTQILSSAHWQNNFNLHHPLTVRDKISMTSTDWNNVEFSSENIPSV